MAVARGFSTPRFRKDIAEHACVLMLVLAFSAGPSSAADAPPDFSNIFLRQLLENSAHRLGNDTEGCLTKSSSLGKEIAAILNYIAVDEVNMALTSSCQKQSGNADFCTLSFSTTSGEEQASAGFVFRADPTDQRIDLDSIECFQTP